MTQSSVSTFDMEQRVDVCVNCVYFAYRKKFFIVTLLLHFKELCDDELLRAREQRVCARILKIFNQVQFSLPIKHATNEIGTNRNTMDFQRLTASAQANAKPSQLY